MKSQAHGRTTYEVWYQKVPNIKHMRSIGYLAYYLIKEEQQQKFESKIKRDIFVGYNENNFFFFLLSLTLHSVLGY